jgi:hypothetical protein
MLCCWNLVSLSSKPAKTRTVFSFALMPEFDYLVKTKSKQAGLDYCVKMLSEHLHSIVQHDYDSIILISSSRGAGCMLEAILAGSWDGMSIFISPIIWK